MTGLIAVQIIRSFRAENFLKLQSMPRCPSFLRIKRPRRYIEIWNALVVG